MGWETVAWCEWDSFCQKVLIHHFPEAEQHGDITTADFTRYAGQIDILTGGFPCQGFSLAGKRLGTDDDRYLWPEMLRAVKETRPFAIVGENVTGILSMEDRSGKQVEVFPKMESRKIVRYDSIDHYEAVYTRQAKMLVHNICEDLEKEGYEVQPIAIPAASVGAPHRRERVWFLAYTKQGRGREILHDIQERQPNGRIVNRSCGERITSNSNSKRLSERIQSGFGCFSSKEGAFAGCEFARRDTANDWAEFPTQSPICSRNDGLSSKLDGITFSKWREKSIGAYGNAIVPQVAYQIFKAIEAYEQ